MSSSISQQNLVSKQEVLNKLFSFQRFGIKPGLERTLELLDSIDNPHQKLKFIHIAGTNGKGSVSSALFSILLESGYQVGLYTSPHIFEFNERIRISDKSQKSKNSQKSKLISDDDIVRIFNFLIDKSIEIGSTFFEITTAMAFQYFYENNIEIVVLETGMGGRFDSTNVVTPLLSIITKIDYDHQEYLGNTIELITNEKAGIIKHNIPVVVNNNADNVVNILKNRAVEVNSPFYYSKDIVTIENVEFNSELALVCDVNLDLRTDLSSNLTEYNRVKYLAGLHQIDNLKSILVACEILNSYNFLNNKIISDAIISGLKNVNTNSGLRYRLEYLHLDYRLQENDNNDNNDNNEKIELFADVSHNPNSISAAIDTLKLCNLNDLNVLFSVMSDKDITEMLKVLIMYILNTPYQKLVLTQIDYSRAIDVELLYKRAVEIFVNIVNEDSSVILSEIELKDLINSKIIKINEPKDAFDYLANEYILKKQKFICMGSFYLFDNLKQKLN